MRLLKTYEKLNKFGIPLGYKRVEYLESTGTQYIDTGFTCTSTDNYSIIENVEWTSWDNSSSSTWNAVEGQTGLTNQAFFGPQGKNTTNKFYYGLESGGITYVEPTYTSLNERHIYELTRENGNSIIKKDNVELYNGAKNGPLISKYLIFGCWNDSGSNIYSLNSLKNYGTKIVKNGSLVRDFIPCIDPLGRACMYDLVGKKAYYNQGTGADFSYGRQIILVKYLESTGTQYIDTGITGTNENMGIDVTWAFSNNNANMCIFSSRSAQTSNTLTLFWVKTVSNRMRFDGRGQTYFTDGVNASVSDDIFNFNYKSADGAVATLTNETTGHVQTTTIGKLKTFSTKPLYLFASRDTAVLYSWIKMYSCRIYDGSTILRDYIPCIDENNVPFMYDLVTNTIYENKGTGSFLFGEEVYDYKLQTRLLKDNSLPAGYTQVDYIEAKNSGNDIQYAVSDYRLTDTTDWEITFSASASSSNWVLGQPTWIGVHYKKDTSTSNLPKVGITNSSVAASQCYVDYTDNEKITLALKGTEVYVNGVKAGSITRKSAPATQTKYGIFAYKDISQDLPNLRVQSARIYRLKVWDKGVLVQDLIPAIKEGVAGFYERVNKIFIEKESNSTSDFTTGKPVLPVMRFLGGRDFSKYTFLNYLESTGTQYIDTLIKPSEDLRTEVVQAYTGTTIDKNSSILGSKGNGDSRYWINYDRYFEIGYGDYIAIGVVVQPNEVNTIDFNYIKEDGKHYFSYNGTEYTKTGTPNTEYNIILFGRVVMNNAPILAPQRIYNVKFIINGVLIRNFLPALRKSDNKPGMLDIITKQFFTNAGTGEFLYG